MHILASVLIVTLKTHTHTHKHTHTHTHVSSPVLSLCKLEYASLSSKSVHAFQSKIISFRDPVSSPKECRVIEYPSDRLSSPSSPCRPPQSHQEMLAQFKTRCYGFVLHHLFCHMYPAPSHDTPPKLCSWEFVAQHLKNQETISSHLVIWLTSLYRHNFRS